jgi:hypothetical protein
MYLAVLGTTMMASILAITGLQLARMQNRVFLVEYDLAEARRYALAGIQAGLLKIKQNNNWRTALPNGTWETNQPIGGGTYTLECIDPVDGNLANSSQNPIVMTATGVKGTARQKLKVMMIESADPLPALGYGLHAAGPIDIAPGKSVRVDNARLSCNGVISNKGTIQASVECQSFSPQGTIVGSSFTGVPPKALPNPGVFEMYKAMATTIPNPGTIDRQCIGPARNPFSGGTNANGVYYIDATNNDLTIKRSRFYGTLLVKLGASRTLTLDDAVLIHNFRPDFPTLIVDGGTTQIRMSSGQYALSELTTLTNFNPSNCPYNGDSDFLTDDVYPNEVQGLVHIRGSIRLRETARVNGVLLGEGQVDCDGSNQITTMLGIYRNPPLGYTVAGDMIVPPGQWVQAVD